MHEIDLHYVYNKGILLRVWMLSCLGDIELDLIPQEMFSSCF